MIGTHPVDLFKSINSINHNVNTKKQSCYIPNIKQHCDLDSIEDGSQNTAMSKYLNAYSILLVPPAKRMSRRRQRKTVIHAYMIMMGTSYQEVAQRVPRR